MSFLPSNASTNCIENNVKRPCVNVPYVNYSLLRADAHAPERQTAESASFDMTLVERTDGRHEDATGDVNVYSTGVTISPPPGYYCEIVIRPSLVEQGYMLATGTVIVDSSYRGEIKIPLYKYKDTRDLDLPCRAVQLIVKKSHRAYVAKDTKTQAPSVPVTSYVSAGGHSRVHHTMQMTTPHIGNRIVSPAPGGYRTGNTGSMF